MAESELVPVVQRLPSGRSVVVSATAAGERLAVCGPEGGVEVEIALTPNGPVVRVHGAKLEVTAAADVSIACDKFHVTATEMRVRTEKSIHLNGETVRLNCTEDVDPPALPPAHDCAGHS